METTITSRGQITIPKHIRDSFEMKPGSKVEVAVNHAGEVVLRKSCEGFSALEAEFDKAIGSADVEWRTDELMALLRGED